LTMNAVTSTGIRELEPLYKGKVRDIYKVDDGSMLMIATDRISAFDVVFNEGLGRTDLPGGNGDDLKTSIRRLSALEVDALWPGHGEPVEGGSAVRANFDYLTQVIFPLI